MATTCFAFGKQVRQVDKGIYTPSMRSEVAHPDLCRFGLRAPHVYAACVTAWRRADELKDKVGERNSAALKFLRRTAIQPLRGFYRPDIRRRIAIRFHFTDCFS